jgi:hypothetical protein
MKLFNRLLFWKLILPLACGRSDVMNECLTPTVVTHFFKDSAAQHRPMSEGRITGGENKVNKAFRISITFSAVVDLVIYAHKQIMFQRVEEFTLFLTQTKEALFLISTCKGVITFAK